MADLDEAETSVAKQRDAEITIADVGNLKKNGYVLIKEKVGKIYEITTAKPGKHGSAKHLVSAFEVFCSGEPKKLFESFNSGTSVRIPHITSTELMVINASDDGFEVLDDVQMQTYRYPSPAAKAEIMESLESANDADKSCFVTLLKWGDQLKLEKCQMK